ncbi:MAG: DUF222 domain-containing protein [Acidimicrobiia bacterium]|nr:DUF222 domain-containing protein [Acidimicrobiia bacterium]
MFGTDVDIDSGAPSHWVPADLDNTEPGSALAAVLDEIDINQCTGFDRIRVLRAHQRMQAHYAARSYRAMSAVVEAYRQDPDERDSAEEAASAEVAAALRLTRRAADTEVGVSIELRKRLPRVWMALCDGLIDVRRARILVDDTAHLSIARASEVVGEVIDDACLLTSGQLRAKLRKLCIQVDPDDAKVRYQRAVAHRRVVAGPNADGTADLYATNLPAHRVQAARQRLDRLARERKRKGDNRSIDQLRADLLLDLLDGTLSGGSPGKGSFHITADLATLADLAVHPGDLAGFGPVIADIARQVARQETQENWWWTVTDPDTGLPIHTGTTRRRPTAAQRRKIVALNPTCVHPGCRMPAVESDIDHSIPWAQSHRTRTKDLAPLCRYHHRIRHQHGWAYRRLPNGDYLFTSPLGHQYTTSGRDP